MPKKISPLLLITIIFAVSLVILELFLAIYVYFYHQEQPRSQRSIAKITTEQPIPAQLPQKVYTITGTIKELKENHLILQTKTLPQYLNQAQNLPLRDLEILLTENTAIKQLTLVEQGKNKTIAEQIIDKTQLAANQKINITTTSNLLEDKQLVAQKIEILP